MDPAGTVRVTMPTARELVLTRTFEAPRHLVFDALTRPELLVRWYGPASWPLVICEIDLRVGGAFRFVWQRTGGKDVGQRGVYREVDAPARLVHTESWEDWNPGEVLVTVTLDEQDERTTLTSTVRFPSQEVRDMLVASGMTDHAGESYDRLAALLPLVA